MVYSYYVYSIIIKLIMDASSMTHWIAVTVLFSERASAKSAKPLSLSGFELSL